LQVRVFLLSDEVNGSEAGDHQSVVSYRLR